MNGDLFHYYGNRRHAQKERKSGVSIVHCEKMSKCFKLMDKFNSLTWSVKDS